MGKSHIGIGVEVCPICLDTHTESVILDKRLRKTIEEGKPTCTGFSLCPECEAQREEYLAFVEVTEKPGDNESPLDWKRTHEVAKVRRSVVPQILKVGIPDATPLVFVEDGFIAQLKRIQQQGEQGA